MERRFAPVVAPLCATALILSCSVGNPANNAGDNLSTATGGPQQAASTQAHGPVLRGVVKFPERRTTQATSADIIKGSALYLIDPDTNKTISATVSRADGTFDLVPPASLVQGIPYVLEGVKGLKGGLPGGDAVRLRSLVVLNGQSWSSISTTSVVVDALTTAVAVTAQLFPGDITRLGTMNKVQVSNGLTGFNPTPSWATHSDLELLRTALAIKSFAAAEIDPVSSVTAVKPTLTSLSAPKGKPGDLLQLGGDGFYVTPGGNTVFFGTATASIILAQPKSIVVSIPNATGDIKVRTPHGDSGTMAFTVDLTGGTGVQIANVSPASAISGETITIYGAGFDPDKTKNEVYFGFIKATPSTAGSTTLVVTIPAGIASSLLTVKAPLGTSNAVWFEVPYRITSAPSTGLSLQEAVIQGVFPAQAGEVFFNGTKAEVLTWTTNQIKLVIPVGVTAGPITLSLGGSSITGPVYTPRNGSLGAWTRIAGTPGDNSSYFGAWHTSKFTYLADYNSAVYQLVYDANGGVSGINNVGRLGLPNFHPPKTAVTVGNFAYFDGDYSGDNRRVWRAPVNSDGVTGNFAIFNSLNIGSGAGTSNWGTNTLYRIRNKLYCFRMDRRDYGIYNNEIADIQDDAGNISAWRQFSPINSSTGYLLGDIVLIGNRLVRLGGWDENGGSSFATADAVGNIGAWTAWKSIPGTGNGLSAAVVGKYLYILRTEQNTWWRAPILAGDDLGTWEQMPGGLGGVQEYHTDRMWVRGNYAYFWSRFGLAQAAVLD